MKKFKLFDYVKINVLLKALIFLNVILLSIPANGQPAGSPVANNGALKVSGNRIVNKNDQVASFSGPSTATSYISELKIW